MNHYIVAWTGGYEAPSYEYRDTQVEAFALAAEWLKDIDERDTIDILVLDDSTGTINRIDSGQCKRCFQRVLKDSNDTLIGMEDGGDVCGWDGGNEPHEIKGERND